MSEYQYYEFLSIDKPLSKKEMEELRDISTRAEITPASFINEYNWGDLKADPLKLMRRYFDAHVYVANWMTAIFMVRIPIDTLSKKTVNAMRTRSVLDFDATKTHWIITWALEESDNYERFGMEEGSGWMARLAPVRDELLRGDLRSLYIGWLAAVGIGFIDEKEPEPLSINGLGNFTAAQQALAEFLDVDQDLLAGAGMGSQASKEKGPSQKEIDQWLLRFPNHEVISILNQLLSGKGQQAERILKNRFSDWHRSLQKQELQEDYRLAADLLKNAETAKEIRLEKKKEKQKQLEIRLRKERDAYLKSLARNFPNAWKAVEKILERTSASAYDSACSSILDLSESYSAHASKKAFKEALHKFITNNIKRKALIQRLVKAGVWKS